MADQFIHLRKGDRTQRLVKGKQGEKVAEEWEADGWKQYEPEQPYTEADSLKTARAAAKAEKEPTASTRAASTDAAVARGDVT